MLQGRSLACGRSQETKEITRREFIECVAAILAGCDQVSPARRVIVFPQGGPLIPSVLSGIMPKATVGTFYSYQFVASGGTPPYTFSKVSGPTWFTVSASGVGSGTPPSAESDTILVTVTDSIGQVPPAPTSFSLTVQGTTGGAGPQQLWPGYSDTRSVAFMWWPPATQTTWCSAAFTGSVSAGVLTVSSTQSIFGALNALAPGQQLGGPLAAGTFITSQLTGSPPGGVGTYGLSNTTLTLASQGLYTLAPGAPDYYKVYRDGTFIASQTSPPLLNPGVTASQVPESGVSTIGKPIPFFIDTLTPSATPTSHSYTVTSFSNGQESSPSPALVMTARATGTSRAPTPAVDPGTWEIGRAHV